MMRCLVLLTLILVGCKKAPPPIVAASGTVTLDGQPLPGVTVSFYPLQEGVPGDYIASAETDENGKYTLMTNGQSGACACSNHVVVVESAPPRDVQMDQLKWIAYKAKLKNRPIPETYASLATSPLKIDVKADQADYPITLKR